MAISKVSIKNFTVYEDIEVEFCNGINVFIGENGTGKTHLLKLLYSGGLMWSGRDYDALARVFDSEMIFDFKVTQKTKHGESVAESESAPVGFHFIAPFHVYNTTHPKYKEVRSGEKAVIAEICIESDSPYSSVFIPSKDMLTHSKGLLAMVKKYSKEMPFDKVLLDIIENASRWKVDVVPDIAKKIAQLIENAIDGTVLFENEMFFILKHNGDKVSFSLEAEGYKKLGLLWQLLMNESINLNTVLIWDEPDANLNPGLISIVVDILLELSRYGVQIFLATHNYNLMKYFSVKRQVSDQIDFFSLYKTDHGVAYECEDDYSLLEHNAIVDANIKLLEDDIERVL